VIRFCVYSLLDDVDINQIAEEFRLKTLITDGCFISFIMVFCPQETGDTVPFSVVSNV